MFDEWHDWWRLLLLIISGTCLVLLGRQFAIHRKEWLERQRDRWFMLVMWCLAAFEMQIEGLLRDTPLRYRLVFVTVACVLSLRLLTKKDYPAEPHYD